MTQQNDDFLYCLAQQFMKRTQVDPLGRQGETPVGVPRGGSLEEKSEMVGEDVL